MKQPPQEHRPINQLDDLEIHVLTARDDPFESLELLTKTAI